MKQLIAKLLFVFIFTGNVLLIHSQVRWAYTTNPGDLRIEQTDSYDNVLLDSCELSKEVGKPQLPVRVESFVVPLEAKITGLKVLHAEKQKINGSFIIFPAQPPVIVGSESVSDFIGPDPVVYNSNDPYPGKLVQITGDDYTHGHHVVTVSINPVEYIPKTSEIYLYTRIEFIIEYKLLAKTTSIKPKKQSAIRDRQVKQFIRSIVRNPDYVNDFASKGQYIVPETTNLNDYAMPVKTTNLKSAPVASEQWVPDYIIITNEELKPVFQTLADWKTKKGVPALIKTVEDIYQEYQGVDNQEKIRNYLKDAFTNWDAGLFVLLGGDVNIVPARMIMGQENTMCPTDLYYATREGTWNANNNSLFGEQDNFTNFDKNDYGQDFYLGRASVENSAEAQTFVDKVINYEKYSNLNGSTYVNNNLFLLGFLEKTKCGVYYDTELNAAHDVAVNNVAAHINNWFVVQNNNCQFDASNPYNYPYSYKTAYDPMCNSYVYLNEDFENNINQTTQLPAGWTKSTDNNWYRVLPLPPYLEATGCHAMCFKASTIGKGNYSYLYSPAITIDKDKLMAFFSIYKQHSVTNEKVIVDYELNNSGNWVNLCEANRGLVTASSKEGWYQLSTNKYLPIGSVKFRIKGVSDGGTDVFIDHISILDAQNKTIRPSGNCIMGNQLLSKPNAISCLNNGGSSPYGKFHIVYHHMHSSIRALGITKEETFYNSDFDNLTNGNCQQILISGGCKPATFTLDCIGEHFINNPNGGGVAFIGNADNGNGEGTTELKLFCDALYDRDGHPATDYNLGRLFQKAQGTDYTWKRKITLLGDPEMPVWSKTPQTLSVTVSPSTIVCGTNTIVVTINNLPAGEEALICLWKGEEGYCTKQVKANGNYTFTFTPKTTGQLAVTVTCRNFIPFEKNIPVNVNQGKNIFVSNVTFDDDKTGGSMGNNDQQTDAGEKIELSVELKNNGLANTTGVAATLSCSSPYITISNNQASFGTINAGSVNTAATKFVFTIDKNAPEIPKNDLKNPVVFTLVITDGAGASYTEAFNMAIHAPQIEQAHKTLLTTSDGDMTVEPGEVVTFNIDLLNAGTATATGVTATLTFNSATLPAKSYPAIGTFQTQTNTLAYQCTVPAGYVTGQPLTFTMTVQNEYGRTWPFTFNLLEVTPIPNAATMTFTASKSEIEIAWGPVSNVKGYKIYRSNALADGSDAGSYTLINPVPVPAAYIKDYGLQELTYYYYKIKAVSPTGSESGFSGSRKVSTSYPLKMNPIQIEGTYGTRMLSSVNVADVNADGYKEIFASIYNNNEGYILAFKHDGGDLYELDGNATLSGGFAHVDGAIGTTPAIAEPLSDGSYKVYAGSNYYISSHTITNNNGIYKPEQDWQYTIPDACYRSPIITDINNDGVLEALFYDAKDAIRICSTSGKLLYSFGGGIGGTYGALAVADIDGDYKKEIIGSYYNDKTRVTGVYVWRFNGANFGASQPFYTLNGYDFLCSPVVCNLDNMGTPEIVVPALKAGTDEGRIFVIKSNGSLLSGWGGTQTITFPNDNESRDISVGDLNGDGKLEVVALGIDVVKVWNNTGAQLCSVAMPIANPNKLTPILADVDNNPGDAEIVFGSNTEGKVFALKYNGTPVTGFPLTFADVYCTSPCVADIDGNGKNDIIAVGGNSVYIWETNGSASRIEWGSERFDCMNAGEYTTPCPLLTITANTTWSAAPSPAPCKDIVIETGTLTLTATCTLTMANYSRIIVKPNGKLVINGGKVLNTGIVAYSGSSISIINNGYVKLSKTGNLVINTGTALDYTYGTIDITQ